MAKGFTKKELEAMLSAQLKVEQSLGNVNELLKEQAELTRQINHFNEVNKRLTKEITKNEKERNKLISKKASGKASLSAEEEERLAILEAELEVNKDQLDTNKNMLKSLTSQRNINQQILTTDTLRRAVGNDILRGSIKLGKSLWQNRGYYDDQLKALKKTELSVGIIGKQTKEFRNTLTTAAMTTNMMGANVSDLAELQAGFSDGIGRATRLTEDGAIAMAALSEGTVLSKEGAIELTTQMDKFNVNAEATKDFMDETLNAALKMGVNSSKATKNLTKSLRMAQTYRFRNGVKDATEMAVQAAKFNFELEGAGKMAEGLLNPEGAVDMASKLQVLGGAWSNLADPFQLMFQARNDMKGLQDSIINATKGMASFNRETGEIEMSALEMHRLREIANATGMDFENLNNTARQMAKSLEVKGRISANVDDDLMDFISTTAEFDKDRGEFYINIAGQKKFVNQLTKENNKTLKAMKEQKTTAEENAKASKTFDETWKNLQNTFKTALLPAFSALDTELNKGMQEFIGYLKREDFLKKMVDLGKWLGDKISWIGGIISENPVKALVSAIGGLALFKGAQWFANGLWLAKGFKAGTGGTGSGGGGILDFLGMGGGKKTPSSGKYMKSGAKMLRGGKYAKGASSILKGVGKGFAPLAALGAGMELFSNINDDSLSLGDSLLKTLDQNKGMAMGAAIGSVVPVIGTAVGAGIGGLADLFMGEIGDYGPVGGVGQVHQDFVMRPGQAATPFTSKDTLIGLKDGGPIEKSFGKIQGNSIPSETKVKVDPIKIEGTIKLEGSGGSSAEIDLSNPKLMNELSRMVQETIAKNINGGKLSPNV